MNMRTLSSVTRPQLLSRALDDLSAIASVARSAPGAGGVALARADRLEKRLTAVHDELKAIQRDKVTTTHMVPTQLHRLLRLPDEVRSRYDVSTMRNLVHGAGPCPESVKREIADRRSCYPTSGG